MFRNISVVEMLLYLYGYTHADVALSVNCFSWYICSTKCSHELALKKLACYMRQSKYSCLLLNPNYDVCKVDTYPYADFSRMYVHEEPIEPKFVQRCTIFIITFADFPVLWVSKLHTKNSLLAMEGK